MRRCIAAVVVAAIMSGCVTGRPVRVATDPDGATLRVNGGPPMKTPATFTDEFGASPKTYLMEVEHPGYKKQAQTVPQATNAGCVAGYGIGGLFLFPLWLGLLWCSQLPQDQYYFKLEPEVP